jgi:glucose/arabinose dehydrogenase
MNFLKPLLLVLCTLASQVHAQTTLELTKVVGGLNKPLAMVQPNGDPRLFIVEQEGLIKVLENGVITDVFLDLSSKLVKLNKEYDERGVLGLAFHPNFKQNGRFFVAFSAPIDQQTLSTLPTYSHINVIEEFTVPKNPSKKLTAASGKRIMSIPWPHMNHNGHWIGFGSDGKLYAATGDGGYSNVWSPESIAESYNSQKLDNYFGKILRIDIDRKSKGKSYAIPADNPMTKLKSALPEIWAFGLRDPWRCSFDTKGSKQLICGDVQEDSFESIKIIQKGKNMGWPIVEGQMRCFSWENPQASKDNCDKSAINPAVIEYPNCSAVPNGCKGISVAGGYIHRGKSSKLNGKYIFGDWSKRFDQNDGQIFVASPSKTGSWSMLNTRIEMREPTANGKLPYILSFAQDSKGNVYALTAVNSKRNKVFEDAIYMVKAD